MPGNTSPQGSRPRHHNKSESAWPPTRWRALWPRPSQGRLPGPVPIFPAVAAAGRSPKLDPRIARQVDLILDGGPLKGGVGSTVVDVTGEAPVGDPRGEVSKPEILAA